MWVLFYLSRELVKNDSRIWSERFPCKEFPGMKSNQDFNSLANKNWVLKTKNRLKMESYFSLNVYLEYKEVILKLKCYWIIGLCFHAFNLPVFDIIIKTLA